MCVCVVDCAHIHSGIHSDRAHPTFLKGSGGACPQCLEKLILSLLTISNAQ